MESELDVFVLFKKQLYEQAERARCVWQNLDLKRVLQKEKFIANSIRNRISVSMFGQHMIGELMIAKVEITHWQL